MRTAIISDVHDYLLQSNARLMPLSFVMKARKL